MSRDEVFKYLHLVPETYKSIPFDVKTFTWKGQEYNKSDVESAELTEDHAILIDFVPKSPDAAWVSFKAWRSEDFVLHTMDGKVLRAKAGMVHLHSSRSCESGDVVVARFNLVTWVLEPPSAGTPCLWCCHLEFRQRPWLLEWNKGNLHISGFSGVSPQYNWIFRSHMCAVYLIRLADGRYVMGIDVGSESPPENDILVALHVIGLILGRPIHVGILSCIRADGTIGGYAELSFPKIGRASRNTLPAIPATVKPSEVALFFKKGMESVSGGLRHESILVPVGHYFEAFALSMDSRFIHLWIALESLALQVIKAGLVPKYRSVAQADQTGWSAWVKARRDEIERFAYPGKEQKFFSLVAQAFQGKYTKVEHVFRELGLPWDDDRMGGIPDTRDLAVHGGWLDDRAHDPRTKAEFVVLQEMFVALLARLFGYEGPIAKFDDRSKVCEWFGQAESPDNPLPPVEIIDAVRHSSER